MHLNVNIQPCNSKSTPRHCCPSRMTIVFARTYVEIGQSRRRGWKRNPVVMGGVSSPRVFRWCLRKRLQAEPRQPMHNLLLVSVKKLKACRGQIAHSDFFGLFPIASTPWSSNGSPRGATRMIWSIYLSLVATETKTRKRWDYIPCNSSNPMWLPL